MITAIILAAGKSSRMGQPKALLDYRGSSFVATILRACAERGIEDPVVVVGLDHRKVLQDNALKSVTVVKNLRADSSPVESLCIGISGINRPVDGALVWPVDQPHVRPATISELLARFEASESAVTIPTFAGRRGHPLILPARLFGEVASAALHGGTLRDVVRAKHVFVEAEVSDPAVLQDIDTPSDYEALRRGFK